jgi:SAM-dependent MidA family methyltransferase
MTPAAEVLAAEIERRGPIPFHRFMEVALYHPEHGYYRRPRDPFGVHGDFFTAEQLQPVFGILIAARIRQLFESLGRPRGFTVVELGAGRREMAPHLSEWCYIPVEQGDAPHEDFTGVVFSNEFFDALPVDVAVFTRGAFHEELVAFHDGRFGWVLGPPVRAEADDYLRRYFPPPEDGRRYEVNLDALAWIDRIAHSLRSGFVLTIDYGYTRAESIRFPAGTLMGYRRHTAREDVLSEPGLRDITAHVNFTALEERAVSRGLALDRFESLAQTLLAAGEPDQFAAALAAGASARGQLKTLLFGMGDTFRVQLLHRPT